MASQRSRTPVSTNPTAAAIRHLAEQGYERTTAEDLAEAVGLSRSTFFRRFGSKDGVIFADHEQALAHLEHSLKVTRERTPGHAADSADAADAVGSAEEPASETILRATGEVLDLLTRDQDCARLRLELLRRNPALRDRELVISHRYERVLADYLRETLSADTPPWVPTAFAAALVSVHNAVLRDWLRGRHPRVAVALDRDLQQLIGVFAPWLGENETEAGDAAETRDETGARGATAGPIAPGSRSGGGSGGSTRVLVAVYDTADQPEAVLRSVAAQLENPPR